MKAAIATLGRDAEKAAASKDKPAKSEAPKGEASTNKPPEREEPAHELPKSESQETENGSGVARAKVVLEHLETAMRLLPDLRAEGLPPGELADEVDEAVTQLAELQGHVEVLRDLLAVAERGRGPARAPRANVQARRGPWEAQLSSRWDPRYVWTLHRNPAALHGPVLAVRRRVLEVGVEMVVEIARHRATLSRHDLEEHGRARTYGMLKNNRGCEVSIWVYDHCPTEAERAEWLRLRALENAALTSPPPDVWIIRGWPKPGGPDEAVRCKTARAWRTCPREGDDAADRSTLVIKLPGQVSGWIDLLDLVTEGKAADRDDDSLWFYRDQPTPEELKQAGQERRRRLEEQERIDAERARYVKAVAEERRREKEEWARRYAEEFRRQFGGIVEDEAGKEALARFGLTLPCTAEDVNQAFRTVVKKERPHPDQGGSEKSFRELVEFREQALMYVEKNGGRRAA